MACEDLSFLTRMEPKSPALEGRCLTLTTRKSQEFSFKIPSLWVYGSYIFLVISVSTGPLASKPPLPAEPTPKHTCFSLGSGTQGLFYMCDRPPQRDSSRPTEVGLCWLKLSHMRKELSQEEAIQN